MSLEDEGGSMNIQRIVWATDGSNESEEALEYAIYFAEKFGSEILGIHVIPKPEKLLYKSEFHDWTIKVEEKIKTNLKSITKKLSSQGIDFKGTVLRGKPSEEILDFANREKADLIATGKSGLGLIDRMLVGSTTLRIIRESEIPILTVKTPDSVETVGIRNILVPLEISEKIDTAMNYAVDLAKKIDSMITVVYVVRLDIYTYELPASSIVLDDLIKFSSSALAKRVDEIKQKHGELNEEIKTRVIQAINPAVAIAEYASSNDIDLIVINTHGRKGIEKFILGSVTEKVIQESSCAVLAMKP